MSDQQVIREVTVNSENGLHLVPCSLIAKTASRFDCDIVVRNGSASANAKAIFELIGLVAEEGTRLTLQADGDSAEQAVDSLVQLFESDFVVQDEAPQT